jgi:hypothetical protein
MHFDYCISNVRNVLLTEIARFPQNRRRRWHEQEPHVDKVLQLAAGARPAYHPLSLRILT